MFGRKAKQIKTLKKLNAKLWDECFKQKKVIADQCDLISGQAETIVHYVSKVGTLRQKIYELEQKQKPKRGRPVKKK